MALFAFPPTVAVNAPMTHPNAYVRPDADRITNLEERMSLRDTFLRVLVQSLRQSGALTDGHAVDLRTMCPEVSREVIVDTGNTRRRMRARA